MKYTSGAAIRIGGRDEQEDAALRRDDLGVWAVADGLGGHERGAEASAAAVAAIEAHVAASRPATRSDCEALLYRAHGAVRALRGRGEYPPATTLTALVRSRGGDGLFLLHVGDSLCARWSRSTSPRFAWLRAPSGTSAIDAALGVGWEARSAVQLVPSGPRRWLLASDGLTLLEAEIADVLSWATDAQAAADHLVEAQVALGLKRQDNVCAVVVDVAGGA